MVVRGHPSLSLTRQCRLLSIGRSSLYDRPKGESAETLALMRRIDALFLKYPFYGARQMVRHLRREGVRIGRRRAARLMRLLGLQAVYRAPRTSAPHLGHRVYPYLLRGLAIERPNHVWCADITYIPVRRGFLYLVAIMDWASRCVLAWRLSNTLDAGFCVEALDEALARHGTPQIFNTDQGSQFTGFAFTARLREAGIRISMDGRGRCMDNIFIERLWRSLKYEAVYLHEIADGFAARRVIGQWIGFYNTERPHSALGGRTPAEAYRGDTPVDMMDKPLRALTTYPQAQQQQQKDRSKRILAAQTSTGIHLENAVSLSDKPTPPQTDPLAIKHIALATGDLLRHPRRHEHHLEAGAIQNLVDRNPVHRGRLHRHLVHPAGRQPCRHLLKIPREGIERPDRFRTTFGVDRDIVNVLADIDPGTIPVHDLQALGPSALAWHPNPSSDRFASLGSGRNHGKSQSLERGRGNPAPSVTEADHGSGHATLRVPEHAIAKPASTAPTARRITSSNCASKCPFLLSRQGRCRAGVDATMGTSARLLSKKNLRHCFRPNFHIRGFDNLDQLVAELSGAAAEV